MAAAATPPAEDAVFVQWRDAHHEAYGDHGLRHDRASVVPSVARSTDPCALLRCPGLQADVPGFVSGLMDVVLYRQTRGIDRYYFDVLDAAVMPGGPLGAELAGKAASTVLRKLSRIGTILCGARASAPACRAGHYAR